MELENKAKELKIYYHDNNAELGLILSFVIFLSRKTTSINKPGPNFLATDRQI